MLDFILHSGRKFAMIFNKRNRREDDKMEMTMQPQPGLYRHFKGGEYRLIGIASHSETLEPMVVYQALYGEGGLWVRPAAMWDETVLYQGEEVKRFTRIGD